METAAPLVSVLCLTYNHEKYIRDCLDGFIKQKTNFPFEVIVHDDASTDNTQTIIREYEEKYPSIIKPIYQTINQYQQGIPIFSRFIYPRVRGKYVAICEGDDYWIDKEKLQQQVGMMEKYPECHFCVCGVQEVSVNKTPLGYYYPNTKIENLILDTDIFIGYASKYAFQTSSYMMRFSDWSEFIQKPPLFMQICPVGDTPMLLYFGCLGKSVYINKIMSCYRRGAESSYNVRKAEWNEDRRRELANKMMIVWNYFDEYTNKRYHCICSKKVSDFMFGDAILSCNAKQFFKAINRDYYSALSFTKKIYIIIAVVFPKLIKQHYVLRVKKREEGKLKIWQTTQ